MSFFSFSKRYRGVADVFLRDPDRYRPLLELLEGVMVGPSDLSKIEREVVAAVVSSANGCEFCVGAHQATLAALGAERALVDAVAGPIEALPVAPAFRALLHLVAKLNASPDAIVQADVDAAVRAGWSEQAVEDAINVAGVFGYVNRLVDAFGLEGSRGYFEGIGRFLARDGYAPLLASGARS